MEKNKKNFFILLIISLFILSLVIFEIRNRHQKEKNIEKESVLPTNEILPTVDKSVLVTLISKDKKEVILTIENIPSKTSTIEYELSYLALGNLPKGVMGTIKFDGKQKIERAITLGTCSSGTCVYDQGVEKVKLNLRFEGNYGSKFFEKEFSI